MNLKQVLVPVAAMMAVAVGSGCSSIVKKPEINGVKKVALVSLYADEMIPWTGGQGRVDNFDGETKHRVALQAYKAFTAEFKRLRWEVVPMDTVINNAYYKREFGPQQANKDSNLLAKTANVLGNMKNARYFTAQGLFPIEWPKDKKDAQAGMSFDLANFKLEAKKDFHGQMADLAKNLGVDAVVLVNMDYCYTGATAVLGNGTAKFTAGSWVRAINPDKQTIVNMPGIEERCDGTRGESNRTVAMVGGSIGLSAALSKDAIVTALSEATEQSAKLTVAEIKKAMDEK